MKAEEKEDGNNNTNHYNKQNKDLNDEKDSYDEKDSKDNEQNERKRTANVGWGIENVGIPAIKIEEPEKLNVSNKIKKNRRKDINDGKHSNTSTVNRNHHFDDDNDDNAIMEIPDLEEDEKENDITTQIANAPKNQTRKVQSLKELDQNIKYTFPTNAAFGLDLSLLTNALCPQMAVVENDETWDFNSLIYDVSQELQTDFDEIEMDA